MSIQFQCSKCQKTIQTPDGSAGKDCRCPQCGEVMKVPLGPAEGTPLASPFSYSVPPATPPQSHPPQGHPTQGAGPQDSPFGPASTVNPYSSPSRAPGARPAMRRPRTGTPHRGSTILTFGIVSLVASLLSFCCCYIGIPMALGFGIPAWVMGSQDLKKMATNKMDPDGKSNTQTGMILGIIGVLIATLGTLIVILIFSMQFVLAAGAADGAPNF